MDQAATAYQRTKEDTHESQALAAVNTEQTEDDFTFRYRRWELMQSYQQLEESLDDFVNRIRPLAAKCKLTPEEAEERIIECIIASTPLIDLQQTLLYRDESLTLLEALECGRGCEAALLEKVYAMEDADPEPVPASKESAKSQSASGQQEVRPDKEGSRKSESASGQQGVRPDRERSRPPSFSSRKSTDREQNRKSQDKDAIQSSPSGSKHHPKWTTEHKVQKSDTKKGQCRNCGDIHSLVRRDLCPAFNRKCKLCGKLGHTIRCCYSKDQLKLLGPLKTRGVKARLGTRFGVTRGFANRRTQFAKPSTLGNFSERGGRVGAQAGRVGFQGGRMGGQGGRMGVQGGRVGAQGERVGKSSQQPQHHVARRPFIPKHRASQVGDDSRFQRFSRPMRR